LSILVFRHSDIPKALRKPPVAHFWARIGLLH
jgi:hypothetical protein